MSLDVFQQAFSLSLFSNLVSLDNGTQDSLQKALQLRLQIALDRLPGWQVVWGPVVWKPNPDNAATGPANSWFIAFHPRLEFEDGSIHPTYAIAIAGTPPDSKYVWFYQSLAVNSVADFNAWVASGVLSPPEVVPRANIVPGTPYVAMGIMNPVYVLLTTPSPDGAASAGMTLLDFVATMDWSGNNRLVAIGTSLGCALASTLALSLVSVGVVPQESTLTHLTVGPSPGNKGFTDLFIEKFPARKLPGAKSYQAWNLNVINTIDVVSQAWSVQRQVSPKQNMYNIPGLYGKPVIPFVAGVILVGIVHALRSGVLYFPLPSESFDSSIPPTAPPKTPREFLQIFGIQHGEALFREIGVRPQIPPQEPGNGLTRKTEDDLYFNDPISAALEWAIEHPEEAQKEIDEAERSEEGKSASSLLKQET